MKRKKINIGAISKTLNRSEMKKIMAGSDQGGGGGGTGGCYICIGGIHCYQVGTGEHGKTKCTDRGYPDYGCDTSGSSTCIG
ncbi:hypothetical protein L6773_06555 [Rhodohalobacter sp. WB101]|uniref:Bacteriocin n=1 Tax=Rhodohalobacter sulfatireducens TaxID=2911366 RepID=A0ABS9KBI1_9BACT|nr:hypothetical protein [Rhodohalobacter sulfatireducens]